jgi:hypothetical protein
MKQMDTLLFQHGQSIDEIKNRLNCIENGVDGNDNANANLNANFNSIESIKPGLLSDPDFVNGIVDNIMTNSNLSEIIEQIDFVQTENRELREMLYAQQKTINEMNIMLLKLFSYQSQPQSSQPQSSQPQSSQPQSSQPQSSQPQETVVDEPHQDEPHQDEPQQDEPHQDEPHQDDMDDGECAEETAEGANIALEIVDKSAR